MASGNRAGSEAFAGLILNGVKETGEEFGVGAYGKVFAVDYYGTECAAKEVHSILLTGVGEEEFQRTRDNFLRECRQCMCRITQSKHRSVVRRLLQTRCHRDMCFPGMRVSRTHIPRDACFPTHISLGIRVSH